MTMATDVTITLAMFCWVGKKKEVKLGKCAG